MTTDNISIAIGADHAGFEYKELLTQFLKSYNLKDFGTYNANSVDYPDFAHPVASAVEKGQFNFGILICGSANGVAITANKHQGIRAAICWTEELARLARQHNDANILCIPARFVSTDAAKEITAAFLDAKFEGGRHADRVNKISC
jgi:ribose 5-phosphate isomerase B